MELANPWDDIFRSEGHVFPEPAPVVTELTRFFRDCNCSRLLDLGCGTGRHMVYFARQGIQVCGMDSAPAGLSLAREWLQREHLSADLVLADAWWPLPFRDGAFDAILSTQVIHHGRLAAILQATGQIGRVIRRGGVLFVSVPEHVDPDVEYVEVEPHTYVPTMGSEKGLAHHIFMPEELPGLFPQFQVVELAVRGSVVITLLAIKE